MRLAIIFWACFGLLVSAVSADYNYTRTGPCKNTQTCVYNYLVSSYIHDKRGKEQQEIEATVNLKCDSIGVFRGETVTQYCIDVKNVTATLSEISNSNSAKPLGKGGKSGGELKSQKAHQELNMNQHFCFVRNANGKIVAVFHSPSERNEDINFKKTIASAFQANFAETDTQEETDSQSRHTSRYSYAQKNGKKIQHRIVNKTDIEEFSGEVSWETVDFQLEEDIVVDEQRIIHRSHGQGRVALSSETNEAGEEEDFTEEGPGYVDQDIPPMETVSSYTLELQECIAWSESDTDESAVRSNMRISRSVEKRWKRTALEDDLLAKWDQREHDQLEMRELRESLPDLHVTARRVSRSINGDKKKKARDLSAWKRLMWLESKHGPLPGTKAKVFLLTSKLDNIISDSSDHSRQLRLLIYSLLSFEGSLTAQKALMKALEHCNDTEECNVVIMAITMLTSVHSSTMSHLKSHIHDQAQYDQLLLSYATLGRHKSVEDEVVNTLVDKLGNLLEDNNPEVDAEKSEIVYLLHALGNTGSKKIIPYITPFLVSNNADIQHTAIDALRTVSRDSRVHDVFKTIVENTASADTVSVIMESLIFPFEKSIYYSGRPEKAGESELEQSLMRIIVKVTIDLSVSELTKLTKTYLRHIGTDLAQSLLNDLEEKHIDRANIHKRGSSFDWSTYSPLYDLIATQSQRSADKLNYPCHKALLWAKKVGSSKIHAKLSVGGFGGVGFGYKMFARGVIRLHVYGHEYTAVEAEYHNHHHIENGFHLRKYAKIGGTVYIDESMNRAGLLLPYCNSWTKTLYSLQVFRLPFSIWIWIGTLDIYIEASLDIYSKLSLAVSRESATGGYSVTPTFSVTGGASVTLLLVWRIGLEVSASIDYYIKPEAELTFCKNSLSQPSEITTPEPLDQCRNRMTTEPHSNRTTETHNNRTTEPYNNRTTEPHYNRTTEPYNNRTTEPHNNRTTGPLQQLNETMETNISLVRNGTDFDQYNDTTLDDFETCLGIYHGSNGVDIDLYAYSRFKSCRVSGWRIKCGWGGKKKLPLFSTTYKLISLSRKLLFPEICATCTCSP